jgi:hypothetical protein
MTFRTATALVCAAQSLALLGSTVQYLRLFNKLTWEFNKEFFIMQPIWLLAHATLVLFFFVLLAETKRS